MAHIDGHVLLFLEILCLTVAPAASAQRFSAGIAVGSYNNADFVSSYVPTPGSLPAIAISGKGGFLAGATAEVKVHRNFALSADALYKPLHYQAAATFYPDKSIGYAPATVVTWQFPILLRYEVPVRAWKPYFEAGFSFRTAGNLNTTAPSHRGGSAGAGVRRQFSRVSVAPGIRYTRWAEDGMPQSYKVHTRKDQVEMLFRITWGPRTR